MTTTWPEPSPSILPATRRVRPFWSRVDRSGGDDACWPWRGKIGKRYGYGVIERRVAGKAKGFRPHAIACATRHGPRPPRLDTAHSCHNPPCCNPMHLRWATRKENMEDMARAGRGAD